MSDQVKDRLCSTIDKNRDKIVSFLSDMIGFPSINPCPPEQGKELEVQNWLRDRLTEFTFDEVDYWAVDEEQKRPNVVGILRGKGSDEERKDKALIFNGHCDVVPVQEEEKQKWTVDPWKSTIRDGKIYGRGTSDMKGGLTAFFWAARTLIECGVELKGDLFLESTVGEESGEGATLGAQASVDRGYTAPFAIVAEPTDLNIGVSSSGIFFFELIIPGKETHLAERNRVIYPQKHGVVSGPGIGVDAISKAIPFMQLFERIEQQFNHRWKDPLLQDSAGIATYTINPTYIHGGNYGAAVVPGECRIVYNVRYPNWVNDEDVWNELKSHVEALASTEDWFRDHPPTFNVPVIRRWPPMKTTSPDDPSVQKLAEISENITGKKPICSSFKGLADTTFISRSGIPCVLYGPGRPDCGLHGADEHIYIDDLIHTTKVFAQFAYEWCT